MLTATGATLSFASGYTVTAYEVGGEAAIGASGSGGSTSVTMRAGHGFAVNDYSIKGTDPATFSKVTAVAGNVVTFGANLTVSPNDVFVNLGPNETGATAPNYDGSPLLIYSTMDTTTAITPPRVTTDANGNYGYFHRGERRIWELVRNPAGLPAQVNRDVYHHVPRLSSLPSAAEPGLNVVHDQPSGSPDISYISGEQSGGTIDWIQEGIGS